MCDHCGIDHPTSEQVAPQLIQLSRAFDAWSEQPTEDDPMKKNLTQWAVERFLSNFLDTHLDRIMASQVQDGVAIPEAVRVTCMTFMETAFSVAMLVRNDFGSAYPETVPAPTEEEVEQFKTDARERAEKERAAFAAVLSGEFDVMEILNTLGIELPEGMDPKDVNMSIVPLPEGKQGINITKQKEETGADDVPGMYL